MFPPRGVETFFRFFPVLLLVPWSLLVVSLPPAAAASLSSSSPSHILKDSFMFSRYCLVLFFPTIIMIRSSTSSTSASSFCIASVDLVSGFRFPISARFLSLFVSLGMPFQPLEEAFNRLLKQLKDGRENPDGADQGFLVGHFHDLLEKPMFKPGSNGTRQDGYF